VTIATYPPRRTIVDLALGRIPGGNSEMRFGPLGKIIGESHVDLLAHPGLLRLMPYTIRIH
jgi:hypothetical protein